VRWKGVRARDEGYQEPVGDPDKGEKNKGGLEGGGSKRVFSMVRIHPANSQLRGTLGLKKTLCEQRNRQHPSKGLSLTLGEGSWG